MSEDTSPAKLISLPAFAKRNRLIYLVLILLVIALGLLSRKIAYQLPKIVNLYLGDALWALMIFLITGFIFRKYSSLWVAACACTFCYLIEISQLYHEPWIDALRNTTPGALILGFGFLWSDILAYTIGVGFGWCMEKVFRINHPVSQSS